MHTLVEICIRWRHAFQALLPSPALCEDSGLWSRFWRISGQHLPRVGLAFTAVPWPYFPLALQPTSLSDALTVLDIYQLVALSPHVCFLPASATL